MFSEKPSRPDSQSLTWSLHKNHNTLQFLLAVTPNGIPWLVSDSYGGRISDKEMSRRSGLLATGHFEQGDALMAD